MKLTASSKVQASKWPSRQVATARSSARTVAAHPHKLQALPSAPVVR